MKRLRAIFLAPARTINFVLFLAPMAIVLAYSLLSRGVYGGVERPWTFESYTRLIDPLYGGILLRSFWISVLSTGVCLVLGFPMALFIARSGARRNLYLNLVMLPFWTSFLVRTYAWMFLLRDTGLINTVLQSLGIIHEPLPLLYNDGAVILGLVYGYLPFMILPLYTTLERLDKSLLEASADLGATPFVTLTRIIIPLSAPGIRAGSILVFITCLGAYLTPDLLGGSKTVMIGNVIQNQFTSARDWPFGAAASLALMALVMVMLLVVLRRDKEQML
ncbi:MAG TPA: ABC transporter permease [Bryobacteraceae bacterium]|jgi:spermidine/putrescine transport system permease protein